MYSALASGDTIRHYQKQNNLEEANAGLSWGELFEAGYTGIGHGLTSYGPEQAYRVLRTVGKIFGSEDLKTFATQGIERELRLREIRKMWAIHKAEKGGTFSALKDINQMWSLDAASSLIGDAGLTQRALTRDNALDVIGAAKEKMGLSKEHGILSNGLAGMVEYMGRMLGISSEILLAQDQFFKMIGAGGELAARNHRRATQQAGGDQAKYKAVMEKLTKISTRRHSY